MSVTMFLTCILLACMIEGRLYHHMYIIYLKCHPSFFHHARSLVLRWLQLRDMKGHIEIALSLAFAYMSYYVTQVRKVIHICIS